MRAIREEWEAFVAERAHRDGDGRVVYSERLLQELGETGLATLRYLARRGDREAARLLVERLLGLPEQPFRVQVQALTLEQAQARLREELAALALAPASTEGIVQRAALLDARREALRAASKREPEKAE